MNGSESFEQRILEILEKINNQLLNTNRELREITYIGGNKS